MKIYRIDCEWEMPLAQGTFKTREKAQEAINKEDWSMCDRTLKEVEDAGLVSIEEIEVE